MTTDTEQLAKLAEKALSLAEIANAQIPSANFNLAWFAQNHVAELARGFLDMKKERDEAETKHGEELRRWQDSIRDVVCNQTGEDIDGSGCDSVDPLDLTLTEVQKACSIFEDRLTAQQAQLKAAEEALQRIMIGASLSLRKEEALLRVEIETIARAVLASHERI